MWDKIQTLNVVNYWNWALPFCCCPLFLLCRERAGVSFNLKKKQEKTKVKQNKKKSQKNPNKPQSNLGGLLLYFKITTHQHGQKLSFESHLCSHLENCVWLFSGALQKWGITEITHLVHLDECLKSFNVKKKLTKNQFSRWK